MQRSSLKGRFAPGFLINFLPASEVRILPSPLLVYTKTKCPWAFLKVFSITLEW